MDGFWDLFWWFFWIYVWVALLMILFSVVVDIFRDHSLNGWGKALWIVFLVFFPLLAILVYMIARGRGMAQRSGREAAEVQTRAGRLHPQRRRFELVVVGRDRQGEGAARRRHDQPGRVRHHQGQGARELTQRPPAAARSPMGAGRRRPAGSGRSGRVRPCQKRRANGSGFRMRTSSRIGIST